ncbi:MAG: adenylate/guanylate cyclase domain-containing protein [Steroidobacteraceae bacterium]
MRLDAVGSQPITSNTVPRGTVLFADLRGFTAMSEKLKPFHLAALLDEYFNILTQVTENHSGRVYHTAGDSIMAGFGLSERVHDGSEQALAAGRSMLRRFAVLTDRWRHESQVDTGLGVGLHLGEVALATFGPPNRRIQTLVGDTANVAARLCSRARAGEVLFSGTVADSLRDRSLCDGAFLQLPRFEMRGRREPLDIWCIPASRRDPLPGFELVAAERYQ